MKNLRWLHIQDLCAGRSSPGSSSPAAVLACLFPGRTAARLFRPVIAAAFVLLAAGLSLRGAPVANADIAKLLDAGISEQVILQTIAVSQPSFDLSPDALIALKNKGATPAILSAMLSTAEGASATTAPAPSQPADATAPSADVPAAQPVQPAPTVVVTQPAQNTPAVVTIVAPPSAEPGQVSLAYFQNRKLGADPALRLVLAADRRRA